MNREVDAIELRSWLHDGEEIAVLDVRDGGPYARSHILAASSAPLSAFETSVLSLVPRRSTRVVVVDDDGSLAARGAEVLGTAGYSNVYVLKGGNPAWEAAGYLLFSGSGIISKAFGELIELERKTPHVEAETLAEWQARGVPHVLFDSRPLGEYRTVSLPGAVDCPGAELVYRVPSVVADETIPVVVNCAGRTRSIIGAQSLRDAGIRNPVFALKNGTMGWQLAGLDVIHGASNMVPEPTESGLSAAKEMASRILERDGIPVIDFRELSRMRGESNRTTYVIDVRQPESFEAAHIAGSLNVAGGQLVQATDSVIAVRHARIVLVDEHMVQSVMTAHWLRQMGWDVSVLADAASHMTSSGPSSPEVLRQVSPDVAPIDVDDLAAEMHDGKCIVVDVGESYWYRQGRIPGSWYSMRSRLWDALAGIDRNVPVVMVCGAGSISPYAAGDVVGLGFSNVRWLRGGRNAWKRSGRPLETIGDEEDALVKTPTDDMWYPPWARKEGVEEAMMQYLTWEVGLLDSVAQETYVRFAVSATK